MVLELGKCEQSLFDKFKEKMEAKLHSLEEYVDETGDHCKALDLYLEKYSPVKTQSMICETMEACLMKETRRNHELYNADKMSLLYRIILSEDEAEAGDIRRAIQRLTDQAKSAIGEEEKAYRRKE